MYICWVVRHVCILSFLLSLSQELMISATKLKTLSFIGQACGNSVFNLCCILIHIFFQTDNGGYNSGSRGGGGNWENY